MIFTNKNISFKCNSCFGRENFTPKANGFNHFDIILELTVLDAKNRTDKLSPHRSENRFLDSYQWKIFFRRLESPIFPLKQPFQNTKNFKPFNKNKRFWTFCLNKNQPKEIASKKMNYYFFFLSLLD